MSDCGSHVDDVQAEEKEKPMPSWHRILQEYACCFSQQCLISVLIEHLQTNSFSCYARHKEKAAETRILGEENSAARDQALRTSQWSASDRKASRKGREKDRSNDFCQSSYLLMLRKKRREQIK